MLRILLVSLCVFPPLPAAAAYHAENGRRVVPIGQGPHFEVITGAGHDGPTVYCAAAEYALRRLDASGTDRVMLIAPIGPARGLSGRQSVGFTLVSGEAAPVTTGIGLSLRKSGESRSVAAARQLCDQRR